VDFGAAVTRLEDLVQALEREGDARGLLLLELVDAIHRPALVRLAEGDLEHPLARALLAMYDLAPVEDHVLVEEALDEVRPTVESHGAAVELIEVRDGVVRLRVAVPPGASGSGAGIGDVVDQVLRMRWAGFERLEAEEVERIELPLAVPAAASPAPRAAGFALPLSPPRSRAAPVRGLRRPVFAEVGSLEDVPPGAPVGVSAGGHEVVLANVEGHVHALLDGCPVDGLPLQGGRLSGSVLVCPWHNCAYDVRSGKRVDEPGAPGLRVLPVAVEGSVVKVAVDVA
jgi:nitrite reductase/ring-hydroxylating ferredoxin subunit/Fe-S cluster biogenesis protein NfuA